LPFPERQVDAVDGPDLAEALDDAGATEERGARG
jgi:hypothetical protein